VPRTQARRTHCLPEPRWFQVARSYSSFDSYSYSYSNLSALTPAEQAGYKHPMRLRFLRKADLPVVRALFDALVAHEDGLLPDPAGIGAIEGYDAALARLPREDALLYRALLALLEWAPLLEGRRRFSRLDLGARRERIERWARSRLLPLRAAHAALKTLALLSYYARPGAWPAMGYDGPWVGRLAVEVEPVPRRGASLERLL
jgi:hypothetical protein